jgi:predicted ATP-grasp superfamily ATP-dependent carboligase
MRIFVYECVCGGGLGTNVPASLLREGHAMLTAVVEDLRRIAGVTVVTLIDGNLSYQLGDECHHTNVESEDFEEVAESCDWTLAIAPEFLDLLHDLSRFVPEGRWLGSASEAIRLTSDKLALAEFWRIRGVRHPWTEAIEHVDCKSGPSPLVLKPRHGAGSQETYLVEDGGAAHAIARANLDAWPYGEFIVQEHIRGQAASVALLIGKHQTIPLAPARQHLSSDQRFRYLGGSLPMPAPLTERATRLALQAVAGIDGLRGYVGVDLVLGDDGVDHAIEINPRITTSYLGLRQLCEQNLGELMLRNALGERVETPTWKAGEVNFAD